MGGFKQIAGAFSSTDRKVQSRNDKTIFSHDPSFNYHTGSKKFHHVLVSLCRVLPFLKRVFLKHMEENKVKEDEKKQIKKR